MILLGWDRFGFCIYNPVRSARLVVILTYVVVCCVMLLYLESFVEIYESLTSSLMVIDEQGGKRSWVLYWGILDVIVWQCKLWLVGIG